MTYNEKLLNYPKLNRGYLNFGAVFSDETENFVSDPEPHKGETVSIFVRGAKGNVDKVRLYVQGEQGFHKAKLSRSDAVFDYFEVKLTVSSPIRYYFAVIKDGKKYFYNKRGLFAEHSGEYDFSVVPGFKTPEWSKGAVIYQIFIDRFYNGDKTNDVANFEYAYLGRVARFVDDWNRLPENLDVCNFYGGDLAGVIKKMGYLKELGVEAIYFTPLFVSPSNHKYDAQDFDYIDPHIGKIVNDGGDVLTFGNADNVHATKYIKRATDKENLEASNRLMAELIDKAHKNGIKVILDGAFNHCGAFHKWLDREGFYGAAGHPVGAYHSEDSKYVDYFRWHDETQWPNNNTYDAWWAHENHPKLNYENSKQLYNYMLNVGKKWVSAPFNADGWRLDVAADLGHSKEFNIKFWADFRKVVKSANPNALILAEHYGDASDWLNGKCWDSVMNYDAFMEPVTWFFTGMQKHSEEFKPEMLNNAMAFENAMRRHSAGFPIQSLNNAMNQLSNHDHSRFLTRTNMKSGRLHTHGHSLAEQDVNKAVFMAATVMLMTWPGCPTLYYGDEAGLCGWTDPDNRRTYPWGNEDRTLLAFHRAVIAVRKANPALRKGSLEYLHMNCGIISYARWNSGNSVICAFNNNNAERKITLPVWKAGITKGILTKTLSTNDGTFTTEPQKYTVKNGALTITMPPQSSYIVV